ncbi:MAG: carboxypeptidase regulatory-like domain-containing protein [Salinibacter sp.]|uniref:carboxypeptidase regulatory-like domain-containing protein n=1 Tax=Salinibacter sp. TaxID=2065818 RepID=UPI002FC306D9
MYPSVRVGRPYVLILASAALLVGTLGCDLGGGGSDDVALSGQVLDAASNPVVDAQVVIQFTDATGERVEQTSRTDSTGRFRASVEVDETTDVTITVSKQGASAQQVRQVSPDVGSASDLSFTLEIGGEEDREPGRPTDILLQDQSASSIRVQESGGTSIARLTFQVVDSTGKAIQADQAVDVDFRFGQEPGDATLTPSTVQTDGQGRATVNVSSGTTAGVVQLVAETERPDGTTFASKPVSLSIHGGLPNKCHFSLAPEQFNFPGLTQLGVTTPIQVFVGDKFGNPVVPGTAVSFSANAGLIGGSLQTDDQGRGSVTLTSAEPLPEGGVGTVRAETAGTDDVNTIVNPDNCPDPADTGNENTISETIPIVFSGRPEVKVDPGQIEPSSTELPQTYELTVQDVQNNNPLAPGTTIQVQAEGTKVKAVGNTDITLDDTFLSDDDGNGFDAGDIVNKDEITSFTFRVVEDLDIEEAGSPTVETVTISVAGPNGSLEIVLTPTSANTSTSAAPQPLTQTEGATVRRTASGGVVVRAPQE